MRGVLVGGLCSLLIGLLAPWSIYILRGSYMALDYSTPAAIAIFFLLVLANRWLHLSRRDMVTAYAMMAIACVVPTGGVIAPLLALSTGPLYYANTGNDWDSLVVKYLPTWTVPNGSVVAGLYEGGGTVLWADWFAPLFYWGIFFGALYLVMVSSMLLLRKQWVEHERLNYPLAVLPITLVEGSILRRWWFWAGFVVPAIAGSLTGLRYYFPIVPIIPLDFGVHILPLRISFPALGFFYLISLPTGLSLWLFTLLGEFLHKSLVAVGLPATMVGMPYGADSIFAMYLGVGALLAMVGIRLGRAREHLAGMWHNERHLFTLLGIGMAVMTVWLGIAGIPLHIVIIFLPIAIAIFAGMTRVVAETGLAVAGAPAIAPTLVVSLLGHRAVGAMGVANLAQAFIWTAETTRVSVMASAAHALKVLTHYKLGGREIWGYAGWAIALAGAAALWLTLTYGYRHGIGSHWFFGNCVQYVYGWAADWNAQQYGASKVGWFLVAGGGLFYWVLSNRYLMGSAYSIHPIGLTVMSTAFMRLSWLSCFLAWLIKAQLVHYWGPRAYEGAKPFFLGLICGQYVANLMWLGIDRITGHTGNQIFWI